MSWLKKLGSVFTAVGQELPYIGPILAAVIPGTKDDAIIAAVQADFAQATSVVANVEAFGQALSISGPDKLKAAAGPMAKVLLASSSFAGKKIKDPVLFQQGATKIADGFADCWNAVDADEVKTEKS